MVKYLSDPKVIRWIFGAIAIPIACWVLVIAFFVFVTGPIYPFPRSEHMVRREMFFVFVFYFALLVFVVGAIAATFWPSLKHLLFAGCVTFLFWWNRAAAAAFEIRSFYSSPGATSLLATAFAIGLLILYMSISPRKLPNPSPL